MSMSVDEPAMAEDPPSLTGSLSVHDPSTIVECNGRYWVFFTSRGVRSLSSKDLVRWERGYRIIDEIPAWHQEKVPRNRGHFWAPDVIHNNGQYMVYYSISSWGVRDSAIGLVVNKTLDPDDPDYKWENRGVVVATSEEADDHNAIDPAVMRDEDGSLWMAYGSFWQGIKLVELDPETGLRISPDAPLHSVAWKESIEAACIFRHNDWYYLIVNWGRCCRGVESTYEMRVGRSAAITGPYLDKDGVDLVEGGGSPLLATSGRFIGPGHAAILRAGEAMHMSYHYYDGDDEGKSRLDILPLGWTDDGWPIVNARPDTAAEVEATPSAETATPES